MTLEASIKDILDLGATKDEDFNDDFAKELAAAIQEEIKLQLRAATVTGICTSPGGSLAAGKIIPGT